MNQFHDERAAELKELFFETALELLQSLNEETLKLEKQPGDLEPVRTIRRIVHTLKGDSAAVGYHELSELAHELEDALALEAAATPAALAEVAFAAADTFGAMLTSYREGAKLPSSEPVRKMIRKMARDPKTRKPRSPKAPTTSAAEVIWTEYEKLSTQAALKQGKNVYHVVAQIDPTCAMPIAAQQLVLKALTENGEVLGTRPEPGSTKNAMQFQLLVASDQTAEFLSAKCRIPTVISQVSIQTIGNPAQQAIQKAKVVDGAPKPPAIDDPAPAGTPEASIAAEPVEEIETVLTLIFRTRSRGQAKSRAGRERLARGCRTHRHGAQSRGRTDHRKIHASAGAQRILRALSQGFHAQPLRRCYGLSVQSIERSAAVGDEGPHGPGRAIVPTISPYGSGRCQAVRQAGQLGFEWTRHRLG